MLKLSKGNHKIRFASGGPQAGVIRGARRDLAEPLRRREQLQFPPQFPSRRGNPEHYYREKKLPARLRDISVPYQPIENYRIIGNMRTIALTGTLINLVDQIVKRQISRRFS